MTRMATPVGGDAINADVEHVARKLDGALREFGHIEANAIEPLGLAGDAPPPHQSGRLLQFLVQVSASSASSA